MRRVCCITFFCTSPNEPQLLFPGHLEVTTSLSFLNGVPYHLRSGLLATAIIKMDGIGGLAGWRWIFVLEGIATVLLSFVAWYFMPTDIASAAFLTPEEKEFARQ